MDHETPDLEPVGLMVHWNPDLESSENSSPPQLDDSHAFEAQ